MDLIKIIEKINEVGLSNNDITRYGDGFEDAIFKVKEGITELYKQDQALQLQQTGVRGSAWIEVLSDHELSEYAEKLEPIWIILEDDEDKKPILAQPNGNDDFYGDDGNIYHYCDISHFMKIERPFF